MYDKRVEDDFVDELGEEKATKTYIIQRKLKWLTIATFVLSMILLLLVSGTYLFFLLNETVSISIESMIFLHSNNRIADIAQAKNNDFKLA